MRHGMLAVLIQESPGTPKMLAIVHLALRRPYTFIVVALLVLLIGTLAAVRMPVDIFPNIDIPVVSIVWQYQGLSAEQMADRIVTITEGSGK